MDATSRCLAPVAEDEAADREGDERPAHVDTDERPRVRLKRGKDGNGGVFDEEKAEPTDESDLQTGEGTRSVQPRDQPGERVINEDRGDDCKCPRYGRVA